jgi:cytochrome b6-f complex iron-sulfur subunit
LKEKLAAARGGGTPAPAATGAKPAAAAKAGTPAPTAKAAAARELPPLDKITDPRDLAEALRRAGAEKDKEAKAAEAAAKAAASGASPAAAAAAAKVAAAKKLESKAIPPKPSKDAATDPTPASATAAAPIARRPFLWGMTGVIVAGWAAFVVGMNNWMIGSLRFMFPNVLAEPPSTIKVGLATNFEKEQVNDRWKAEWGFWIVRSAAYDGEDKIYAIQSVCTHLGCPPNWLAAETKFKCPCHGSGFYISGVNFEGPAPRPLERFKVSQNDAGEIVVDKSQKFQEELKQWGDADSFIVA